MHNEKEVKGYQKGFLNAVGISVEEAIHLPTEELWSLIYIFCGLNDVAMIIEEEERLLLGNFCALEERVQKSVVDEFYLAVLKIRKKLKKDNL